MQSRQPRLGDILDDYCPRERRITNHAVVAMVGEEVKQTRCTTCDAEHEYKSAKVPAQRKRKTGTGALYDEVLTGMPRKLAPAAPSLPEEPPSHAVDHPESTAAPLPAPVVAPALPSVAAPEPEPARAADESEGPVHRQLIRATLPRPEGQKERPIPEFTARTAATRGGRFRPNGFQGHGQGQARGRGGHGQSTGPQAGKSSARRGQGQFATAGAPAHGNRAHAQGHRRRGGRKHTK
jgi:hypothetical protein